MFVNYFIVALRNLLRNKVFFLLNVAGISVGMTATLLILFYILFETSFDTFHKDAKNIYRVEVDTYRDGAFDNRSPLLPSAVAPALLNNFPEVENYTRIVANPGKTIILLDDKSIQEDKAYMVDPSIFDIFTVKLLRGSGKKMLVDPHDLLISESMAQRLWGSSWKSRMLGREAVSLRSQGLNGNFFIQGVFENFPSNSHFRPEILAPKSFIAELVGDLVSNDSWDFNFFYTYIRTKANADIGPLQAKFNTYVSDTRKDALTSADATLKFRFLPLTDIHLTSNIQFELESNGDATTIKALGAVGLVILIIAWINFINLSTARSIRRAKEVGVRKVLGAGKGQLAYQFMMEAILLNTIGLVMALCLVHLTSSSFSEIAGIPHGQMRWALLTSNMPWMITIVGVFTVGTVLSGVYPAFVISQFNPIRALKGSIPRPGGIAFRKGLVVVQFSISLIMISATLIIFRQIRFMRDTDLGVNIKRALVIEAPENTDGLQAGAQEVFKVDVLRLEAVTGFTMSSVVPGQEVGHRSYNLTSDKTANQINCGIIGADADFISTYELTMLAGKDFNPLKVDPSSVILNEEAVHQLGFGGVSDAIGTTLTHQAKNRKEEFVVTGVVKNYHHRSLRTAYEPILFRYDMGRDFYSIVLAPKGWDQIHESIRLLKRQFETSFPGNPFVYFFLDQQFDRQYQADVKFGTVFLAFATLAVIISALGLLGLSTFMVNLRTSEIGIRKVFGASRLSVMLLLCKDYLALLVIGVLAGIPIIWIGAMEWLKTYSFRIEIGGALILIPMLGMVLITGLTVGLHAFAASSRNPIDTIRGE